MGKLLIMRFPYESRDGGEERHSMQLAEGLRRRGCDVSFLGSDLVLYKMMQERDFMARKIWGPKPPVTMKTVAMFWLLMIIFTVRMAPVLLLYRLKGVRTAYCLSLPDKFLTLWMRLIGMRVVWVEHARIGRWLTRNPYLPFYWLLAWLTKSVVFTSDLALRQAPWIPHGFVIPCGIRVDEFTDAASMPLKGVTNDTPVIGVVARFTKDKGVDVFLRAAEKVHARYPSAIFVCCGDGPEEAVLRALTLTLGIADSVVFFKNMSRTDLGRLYSRLSIVVLPSTAFDPFGLVPGEAMALGKPVVVSDVCGIAGYMHDGVDGMIVRAGNSEGLSVALMRLLDDHHAAEKMGASARSLIRKKLHEEKLVENFEKLFFGDF